MKTIPYVLIGFIFVSFWFMFSVIQFQKMHASIINLNMKLDRAFATEKLLNQKIQALETFENQKIENIITHFIEKKEKEILLSIIISWEDSTQNSLMDSFMEVGTNHKTCYTHLGDISCEIIFIREVQYKEKTTNLPKNSMNYAKLFFQNNLIKIIDVSLNDKPNLEPLFNIAADYAKGEVFFFLVNPSPLQFSRFPQNQKFLEIISLINLNSNNSSKVGVVGSTVIDSTTNFVISGGISASKGEENIPQLFHQFKGFHFGDKRLNGTKMKDKIAVSKNGMLVSRKIFTQVGGFNPKYSDQGILQDADFCLKVRQLGFKVFHDPQSRVFVLPTAGSPSKKWYAKGKQEEEFYGKWSRVLHRSTVPYLNLRVVWDLYCSCTGVNIEAIHFLNPLEQLIPISVIAGEKCFCEGFPESVHEGLERIRLRPLDKQQKVDVFISHKPPEKYPNFPYTGLAQIDVKPHWVIGRSMSEAVPISSEWVNSCNLRVDEVWVPSQFHVDEFIKAGVDKNKIFRIPEATDVYLWDPDIVEPLSIEKLDKNNFNFLSVFKWENRKGWDILLQAYFEEFDANEPVTLFLQTYLYGDWNARNPESVKSKIAQYARKLGHSSLSALPKVEVLTKELPARDMPRLYKAFDAFVLPSRGEGWGLPIMEAMAMSMPTIATNWSGPTDFMTEQNSYPLMIDGLIKVNQKEVVGEFWANPSVSHLKELMRRVYSKKEERERKGRRARKDIVSYYSEEKVALNVLDRLQKIQEIIKKKKSK